MPVAHRPADEHCDIREWALHHASLGVGKIYVFDTESQPPMRAQLEDLIASGLVEYSYVTNTTLEGLQPAKPGKAPSWQHAVYPLCIRRYHNRHRWMGGWVSASRPCTDGRQVGLGVLLGGEMGPVV
jgi:hypothetical protein